MAVKANCVRLRIARRSRKSLRFVCLDDWLGKVLSKRRLCHRDDEHGRRVVLVSAKPVAGRDWKSLTRDECIETRKLLLH